MVKKKCNSLAVYILIQPILPKYPIAAILFKNIKLFFPYKKKTENMKIIFRAFLLVVFIEVLIFCVLFLSFLRNKLFFEKYFNNFLFIFYLISSSQAWKTNYIAKVIFQYTSGQKSTTIEGNTQTACVCMRFRRTFEQYSTRWLDINDFSFFVRFETLF